MVNRFRRSEREEEKKEEKFQNGEKSNDNTEPQAYNNLFGFLRRH